MEVIKDVQEMRQWSISFRQNGGSIGFVPTMGFLHEGHVSLLKAARERCDALVVSIFVNPTQFGPSEDLSQYPRDLDRDLTLTREVGADIVFFPDVSQMYPPGFQTYVQVEELSRGLCGTDRPTHFRGVATVVAKLFNQVLPDQAFFGEKDYQQLAVIKRMAKDLDMGVEVIGCPIVREPDGLAMSSRNVYLNTKGRKAALCLRRSIRKAQELVRSGNRESSWILQEVTNIIATEPLVQLIYAEIRHPESLDPLDHIDPRGVLLLAARVENTRLIDNGYLPE
ncbi:MAG: pantoate--beta-alanine ligase [Deltaproteobacteria bacterium]|nr:pantoate--beta-alanine ligase [Deltaproteobacteria bacterium]